MRPVEQQTNSSFQRTVLKNDSPHQYLEVQLVLEDRSTRLTAVELKHFILTGLKILYGEVGAALGVDVLRYDDERLTGILRIGSSGAVRLRSALTLLGRYQNQDCCFRILQASPFLLALTGNSRNLRLR
ncbi:ribonuclease P protein subunit p14 isoform X2 [Cololabis saira]|uniref:ribonuclease P protein subunit p14 isoform X2 n=1 Tax=Cololabis saira TaxID=129043 RepID=UPI002AD50DE2|nr:ribonuclease P protein subunit p14 isoform X2 [Cololabis saira]